MNVLIINGNQQYTQLFKSLGHRSTIMGDSIGLAVFTGGADVTPSYYGDTQHPYTGNDEARDEYEAHMFYVCKERNIPMVGICRGSQILNVLSGGRMYQHVDKHCQPHDITDLETGQLIHVSSTHHQMMMPSSEGLLVASSMLGGGREWFDGHIACKDVSNEDIEVVYYKHTNCLCFQPHPEFEGYPDMHEYFKQCLEKYLDVK